MLNCLFMSDEAHFDLNGNINNQNCQIWSASNPQILHETELHPLHVTVWCAVSLRCIVGSYFFEENGHTVTVTGDRYLSMLREFFYPELRRMRISFNSVWFQKDGAAPHIAQPVMTELRRKFPNKLISKKTPHFVGHPGRLTLLHLTFSCGVIANRESAKQNKQI